MKASVATKASTASSALTTRGGGENVECVTLGEQRTGLATVFDENTKKGDWLPAADLALLRGAPSLRALVLTAQGLVKGIQICREKIFQFLYKPGEGHVGPVIALTAGMVDDHLDGCWRAA